VNRAKLKGNWQWCALTAAHRGNVAREVEHDTITGQGTAAEVVTAVLGEYAKFEFPEIIAQLAIEGCSCAQQNRRRGDLGEDADVPVNPELVQIGVAHALGHQTRHVGVGLSFAASAVVNRANSVSVAAALRIDAGDAVVEAQADLQGDGNQVAVVVAKMVGQ